MFLLLKNWAAFFYSGNIYAVGFLKWEDRNLEPSIYILKMFI